MERITVRQDEGKVILIHRHGYIGLPWSAAFELAKVIKYQAQKAEEYALANQIALDTAVMYKAGLPIGFSDDAKILDMARNEASWNKGLRKMMGEAVKVNAVFGKPKLVLTDRRTINGKDL